MKPLLTEFPYLEAFIIENCALDGIKFAFLLSGMIEHAHNFVEIRDLRTWIPMRVAINMFSSLLCGRHAENSGHNTFRNDTLCISIAIVMQNGSQGGCKFYNQSVLRHPNRNWTKMHEVIFKSLILRGSPLTRTLSFPQQNWDQEWKSGRQIIVTDHGMIRQSIIEALMQEKWVKAEFQIWLCVKVCYRGLGCLNPYCTVTILFTSAKITHT